MFGYPVLTTVAVLVVLGALLSIVPLIFKRDFLEIIKPAAVGAGAWVVGGVTSEALVGITTALVSTLIALLTEVISTATGGLGIDIPVVPIVLAVAALFLLRRSSGKSKK